MQKYLLIPFITAGFPSKKLFLPILKVLSKSNADYIEVGVPFSDPLADGPIIQHSSNIALKNGVSLQWIVETCSSISLKNKIKPLILFSYLNPILQYGFKKLLHDLPKPLFYGLIIPDLPSEEALKYLPVFKKYRLNLILLIAPNTKAEKIKKIANHSQGMIYLVSVTGITGIRRSMSLDLKDKIEQIKSYTDKPIIVGFGINNRSQIKKLISYGANGIVIGSALIKALTSRNKSVLKAKQFIKKLSSSSF